ARGRRTSTASSGSRRAKGTPLAQLLQLPLLLRGRWPLQAGTRTTGGRGSCQEAVMSKRVYLLGVGIALLETGQNNRQDVLRIDTYPNTRGLPSAHRPRLLFGNDYRQRLSVIVSQ